MVVRVRPINWDLLINPTSAGIQMRYQADANLARSIAGAGADIAAGMVRSRREREDRRQFDASLSLRRQEHNDSISLRRDELSLRHMEKERDRQSNETDLLDGVESAVEMATGEAMTQGQVSPQTGQALNDITSALGGPEATQAKLASRCADGSCALPASGSDSDPFAPQQAPQSPVGNPSFGGVRSPQRMKGMNQLRGWEQENEFQAWYGDHAKRLGLNPNPDDPAHKYDYREAFRSGAKPDAQGHWPSQFKADDHPNRFVGGVDTKYASAPNPAVGEMGVEDMPSVDLSLMADDAKRQVDAAKVAMDAARAAMSSKSLHSAEGRARAKLAYERAFGVWTGASAKHSQYTRRAAQAQKREGLAEKAAQEKAQAEAKAADEARDAEGRGAQFDAILAGLSPEARKRMEGWDAKAMRQEAVLGGDPQQIANRALLHRDANDRVDDLVTERDGRIKAGLSLPPHLMKPEERESLWMDRMTKRANFYEQRGLAKSQAAAEAKADHDVEKRLHALLWENVKDKETGRVTVTRRPVMWSAFSKEDKARLVRIYRRNELEEAAEEEMVAAQEMFEPYLPTSANIEAGRARPEKPQAPSAPAADPKESARAEWKAAKERGASKAELDAIVAKWKNRAAAR